MYIDHSIYPDLDAPPDQLDSIWDKADYLQRICAAWDFYIMPEPETFELLSAWKHVFDRFPLVASPAYHTFRDLFGWERAGAARHLWAGAALSQAGRAGRARAGPVRALNLAETPCWSGR